MLKVNSTLSPIRKYATVAAVTDDINNGTIDEMVRSSISISSGEDNSCNGSLKDTRNSSCSSATDKKSNTPVIKSEKPSDS